MAKVKRCSRLPSELEKFTVRLKDGRAVQGPLLQWGTPACWPSGSDSFIQRDYLVRGLYYAQLVRMMEFIHAVSAVGCRGVAVSDFSPTVSVQDNIMVLEDSELKRNASDVMSRVYKLIGLPAFDVAGITNQDVYEKYAALHAVYYCLA